MIFRYLFHYLFVIIISLLLFLKSILRKLCIFIAKHFGEPSKISENLFFSGKCLFQIEEFGCFEFTCYAKMHLNIDIRRVVRGHHLRNESFLKIDLVGVLVIAKRL